MTKTQSKFNAATKRALRLESVAAEARAEAEALGKQWLAEVQAQIEPHAPVAAHVDTKSDGVRVITNDPAFTPSHSFSNMPRVFNAEAE